MTILELLKSVFETGSDPVPRYIYEPIARQESGLDPTKWNTRGEDSRGLYQINVDAHPEYGSMDLFDPAVNARVALANFIRPAWEQARKLYTDPGQQAAYVWQYGIRPDWAGVQARGADVELMAEARSIASGTSGISAGAETGQAPKQLGDGGPLTSDFWVKAGLNVGYFALLVLLVILGFWGLMKAFGMDTPIREGVKTGIKALAAGGAV